MSEALILHSSDSGRSRNHSNASTSPKLPADSQYTKSPFSQRLGWYAMTFVPLCTFISSASLAFLWFLWTVDRTNQVWRNIVLAGWVTRVITILSQLVSTVLLS